MKEYENEYECIKKFKDLEIKQLFKRKGYNEIMQKISDTECCYVLAQDGSYKLDPETEVDTNVRGEWLWFLENFQKVTL